jgi:GNAT superfamily N-acetyltransferase
MIVIKSEKLRVLKVLLNSKNSHYPLLKSIIFNNKKGKAYVDCIERPTIAGVLSFDNWFYLLGKKTHNYFSKKLEEILLKKVIIDEASILWFGITDYWKNRLLKNNSIAIEDYPRNEYEFIKSNYKSFEIDYPDYNLEKISQNNVDKLFRYSKDLYSFWSTKELFLEKGFGFILLDDKKIIAHSISASVEDLEVEIDIGTEKEYRGKRVARYLASCLIDECLQKSLIPKWDCGLWNIPSNKLALKLGFEKVKEYPFSIIRKR